jgi:hypothetical protein
VSARLAVQARTSFMASIERRILEPKKKSRTISDAVFERLREEAVEFAQVGDWALAEPRHFVALYSHLHESIYGVAAVELTSAVRFKASMVVGRLLAKQFDGKKNIFASFSRWVWNREKGRHQYRVANGREITRLSWTSAFSGYQVTDWRVATGGR